LVVATDVATQQSFLWEFVHGAPRARQEAIELEQRELRNYLTEVPGPVWFRYPDGSSVALASDGRGLHTGHVPPANFQSAHPHRTVLGATFEMGRQWAARMYLLDPQVRIGSTELQFTSSILQHVAPALYNVYLLRRLRRQGGAVERARVARELHDGAIQTLISAEMQVDVLRRTASGSNGSIGDQLGNIQELLRREVLNLRELMQQMRPVEVSPKQLLDYLADLADRFQRDTGIHAQFVSNLEDAANLPPRLCREVARIVQEALVNVRRHSGASNVLIRFSSGPGAWKLVIDDDGRGFSFSGHFSHDELDAAHKGPLVIKERVRSIGGDLAVESQPGTGARLEISIPHRSVSDTKTIRIVVADDHPIFRDGLRRLLEAETDLRVVGEASDGLDAVRMVEQLRPDLLLLDLNMPRRPGLEVARILSETQHPAHVVLLTAAIESHQVLEAVRLGVRGVVQKDAATELLLKAIRTVMSGQYWVGREKVADIVELLRRPAPTGRKNFGLTPRELEIVGTVVSGFSNRDIAQKLKVSEDTVKHHLTNIFNKTGVSSRLELALFAINHQLTEG
jgi:DNA-binding NarL/FixJ family response regulator/signal transduction histidine kinase